MLFPVDEVLGSLSWRQFADDLVVLDQLTVDRDHHGEGIGPELTAAFVDLLSPRNIMADSAGVTVEPFASQYLEKLLQYDMDVFHCDRASLVKRLVEGAYSVSLLAFDDDMELLGYGVVQEMSNGTGDVSVLLADEEAIAVTLLRALAQNPATPRLLKLTSPAPSEHRNHCFATRVGFSVRQAYVCRFTRRKQVIDVSRVFSFGAL
ncbi:hypothetical protein MTO96_000380 [Rhipicephalus appendiculatus]